MKINSIVYSSGTGHTARYADMLASALGINACPLGEGTQSLNKGEDVIYLGWVRAGSIVGLSAAEKRFSVRAVCAVGLAHITGSGPEQIRKANGLDDPAVLFTLPGGFKPHELKLPGRLIARCISDGLGKKADRTEQEETMLDMIRNGADLVNEAALSKVIAWCKED